MKIIFFILLGIIYLVLANAIELMIIQQLFFIIGIALVGIGSVRYIKARYSEMQHLANMREASEAEITAIPHTQCTISQDVLHALLLNEQTNMLIVAQREALDDPLKVIEIPFNKIYEVAVVEDEATIRKAKNYLIGSSLLDEMEELEEEDTVSQLSLKLVVDHLAAPIVEYIFMENSDHPIERDTDEYEEALELCEQWFQKISVIIKRHELERVPIRQWQ
ncbi:hypothetical protein MHB42_16830 [Lysinibacillus sp. FSL K6-0232]|uniref:hypothetical protein n=1 Tax=unclassified Lysinibacillus TaxID=2636778 RepID=UPI0030F4F8A0